MKRRKDIIEQTTKTLTVSLHIDIKEEDGCFIAYCPALELSSYGKDKETAQKRFDEEVKIFFNETRRKGTLEKYLLKMGWTLKKKPIPEYTPPANLKYPYNIHNSFTENVAIPVS
jgi:predicted RNase H-like HicB family nuclease